MNMTIGVSLDFYNTLVEIDRDSPTIAAELTERGYSCSDDVEAIWNSQGFDGHETHDPVADDYGRWRRDALLALALLCGAPESEADALAADLLALDQKWTVKACHGAFELLGWLRTKGVPHCILTNWDYPLAPYLAMAGLPTCLATLTSAELGMRKPLVSCFQAARRQLHVPPERHIHIGDSWTADVAGAIRSGAWAIWITDRPPSVPLPRRIIASPLTDVSDHLDRLIWKFERE